MTARVEVGTSVLEGVVGPAFNRPDGLLAHRIVNQSGTTVCDARCTDIASLTAPTRVSVEIEVIPSREGVVVPDSALVIQPNGTTAVRTDEGELLQVEVMVQGRGLSIVEGVEAGAVIELFGSDTG